MKTRISLVNWWRYFAKRTDKYWLFQLPELIQWNESFCTDNTVLLGLLGPRPAVQYLAGVHVVTKGIILVRCFTFWQEADDSTEAATRLHEAALQCPGNMSCRGRNNRSRKSLPKVLNARAFKTEDRVFIGGDADEAKYWVSWLITASLDV